MKTFWCGTGYAGAPVWSTAVLCQRCNTAKLPTRERLRAVLDGALEQLNAARLSDALRGNMRDETIGSLAGMAHAMLYATCMLERCEACIAIELERAAALIVGGLERK